MTGCPKVPRDPAFGCAWRKIIMEERTSASVTDVSAARKACSDLSSSDENWLPKLKADIRFQMREIREKRWIREKPIHQNEAGTHAALSQGVDPPRMSGAVMRTNSLTPV